MRAPACLALALALAGCDSSPGAPIDGGGDAPPRSDAPVPRIDAGEAMEIAGGDASGSWCGYLHVTGAVTVPGGETLTVCAGSIVSFDPGVGITVAGTLVLEGTDTARITLGPAGTTAWTGLTVNGALEGDFSDVSLATIGVSGGPTSAVRLDDSTLVDCNQGFVVANGGTFDRTVVRRGTTVYVRGGVLRMTDSIIDLEHPTISPDCTDIRMGGMVLDHVQFTGCHCPIHIVSTDAETTITNSIFDGATNPVMIANSVATFHQNHFIGTSTFLDIGGGDGIMADVSGNYWDGDAPTVSTTRPTQFTGTDVYETSPIPGVGPRL